MLSKVRQSECEMSNVGDELPLESDGRSAHLSAVALGEGQVQGGAGLAQSLC